MRSPDTRTTLLQLIVQQGGATIADLAGELGISDATARRHLDRLEADGLVDFDVLRRPRGRPAYRYRATDDGVRSVRDHTPALAERLLAEMVRLRVPAQDVAEALADHVAAAHDGEVSGQTLEERVDGAVIALRGEGILDGWERAPDGIRLVNHGCPYLSAATANDCVCEADRLTIEKLIGVPVEQTGRVAGGDQDCQYIIPLHVQPSYPQAV